MEQRKERCEEARNVLVDPMHRAYPRNHRDRLHLASPRPNPRHRCHAASAAVPVVAAPFADVSSPSCSAYSLCLSSASSLHVVAGSSPDGVAVDFGHDGVAVDSDYDGAAVDLGHDGVAADSDYDSAAVGSGHDGVAVDDSAAVGSGHDGVAAGSGSGPGGAAIGWGSGVVAIGWGSGGVAADSGGGVAACAGSAHELKRKFQSVAAEHGDVAAAATACADSAPELERRLALVAGGMPLT